MKQKYVIDTTALMSYFSSTFEIQNKMSQHALDIISQAFNNDSIIPSNPQLSSSASFLRLNVLSSLN